MKSLFLLAALGAMGVAATVGVAQIQASPSSVLDFCPSQGATNCSTAATMLVSLSKPADDILVSDIDQIVAAARGRHLSEAACRDTEAGLSTLAGAIHNAAVADLAQKLAVSACGDFQTAATSPILPPVSGGSGSCNRSSSSGVVCSSSSGASSSGSSGTSGDQSSSGAGASSGSSGTSGDQSSSGAGASTSSSGASGNTSSG